MNRRRLLHFFVLAVVLLLAAIVSFYVVTGWRGRTAWLAYAADARDRGVQLSFAEFVPPPIDDAENFAATPFFQAAFAQSPPIRPAEAVEQKIAGIMAEAAQKKKSFRELELPTAPTNAGFSDVDRCRRADLAAWRTRLIEKQLIPASVSSAPADAVLVFLARYEARLAELQTAAQRPHVRFPLAWNEGVRMSMPHLNPLFDASKVVALRCEAQLGNQSSSAALEDWRLHWRLARSLEREPMLLSALSMSGLLERTIQLTWSGLAAEVWNDAALSEIERTLGEVQILDVYAFAITTERAAMNDVMGQIIGGKDRDLRKDFAISAGLPVEMANVIFGVFPRGWVYDNRVRLNRMADAHLAQLAFSQEGFRPLPAEFAAERRLERGIFARLHYALSDQTAPAMQHATDKFFLIRTRIQQARLACALERFRRAHAGNYPETLSALVPDFSAEIPLDPMDGQPLRYRRDPERRVVIHSVGRDLRDDGGRIDLKTHAQKQRDWVWTYPAAAPG